MKKLLCFILALAMFVSVPFAVSAEDIADEPDQMYRDVIFESLGINPEYYFYEFKFTYNADGSTPAEGEIPDYVLFILSAVAPHDKETEIVIDDYYIKQPYAHPPYDLGHLIYSVKEDKCYNLFEAWEEQLPNIKNILATIGTHIDEVDNKYTRYRKEILAYLGWEGSLEKIDYECILEYNADGSTFDEGKADYMMGFAHRYDNEKGLLAILSSDKLGNYIINSTFNYIPGQFVYSVKENKMYTLREAWNKKLPNMEAVLEAAGSKTTLYAECFEEFLEPYGERYEKYNSSWYYVEELYYYNASEGGVIGDMIKPPKFTPDYALVQIRTLYDIPKTKCQGIYGDYIVSSDTGRADPLQYYIYTPEDDTIYTLREAYNKGIDNLDKVFTDYGLGRLMGDIDNDKRLTIKDATRMQKALAKFTGFSLPANIEAVYEEGSDRTEWTANIADFDFNNELNIKDATAIQKRLAKIDI